MSLSPPDKHTKQPRHSVRKVSQHLPPADVWRRGGPVTSFRDLNSRFEEWSEFFLSNRMAHTPVFCGPSAWVPWFQTKKEFLPRVFEKRDAQGHLLALMPMYQDGRSLFVASDLWLDYQELVADSVESASALLCDIADYCNENRLSMVLSKVSERSLLHQALQGVELNKRMQIASRYWSTCWAASFARFPGKTLLDSGFSSGNRRRLIRKRNRIQTAFPNLVIDFYETKEINSDLIAEMGVLHRASQYRKKGESIFGDSGFETFLQRHVTCTNGTFLATLRSDKNSSLMAFTFGYLDNDTFYYYLTSYDDEQASLSPGLYLLFESLECYYGKVNGDALGFDLLCGSDGYKRRWGAPSYDVFKYRLFPRSVEFFPAAVGCRTVYWAKRVKNYLMNCLGIQQD